MHYSGILILSRSSQVQECLRDLAHCPGVDVYATDEASGRIVAAMETETLEAQEDVLRRVQGLPHVQQAMLVYHYAGSDPDGRDPDPAGDRVA